MSLDSYDSPTFLSQKDVYVFGLSLMQMMAAVGIAGFWFLMGLMTPYSTMVRLLMTVGLSMVSFVVVFVQVSGLSLPMFVFLLLLRSFIKPGYEGPRSAIEDGDVNWARSLEKGALGREKKSRFGFLKFWAKGVEVDKVDMAKREMEAEVSRQVNEAGKAAESAVRDGIRALVKGR